MGKRNKPQKERITKYFGTYIGPPGFIRYSGVGEVTRGKEIEISKKLAQAFESDDNWKVRKKVEYKEID